MSGAFRYASLLWCSQPGWSPATKRCLPRVWLSIVENADLKGFVFHELRHTAAALAIAQRAHPMAIKERLGHASITTTLDRYGGLFLSLDRDIANGLDARVRRATESLADQVTPTREIDFGL